MTNRTKAIVSLGGVFLVGALCGALTLGLVVRSQVRDAQNLRDRQGFEQYFADRLRLTEAQRDSLKDELDRMYDELAGLRRSAADEYHELLDTFALRIAPSLTPEQRELLKREEQHFRGQIPRERLSGARPNPQSGESPREAPTVPSTKPPVDTSVGHSTQHRVTTPVKPIDTVAPNPTIIQHADSGQTGDSFQPEQLAQTYRERLKLSDEQSRQVREIMRQTHLRLKRARTELNDYPRELRVAIRRNLREMDFKITDVLNPDQLPAYQELRQELKEKIRNRLENMKNRK